MNTTPNVIEAEHEEISIPIGALRLNGDLAVPPHANGLVVFAHGSGSSRYSPRNQFVARILQEAGSATLLFDLLTMHEELTDLETKHLRFDIDFLADRLIQAAGSLAAHENVRQLKVGFFGSSTGGAAALAAAASLGEHIAAVVSRGGRPDLAGPALPLVRPPTLLIVGGRDDVVLKLNREAYEKLQCEKELKIIPGATHLFEEPGTLEQVARAAAEWFRRHF